MAQIEPQGGMGVSAGDVLETLDFFSRKMAEKGGIVGWFKSLFWSEEGPRLKSVIGLPMAVSAYEGKLYVRLYLLGARRRFGEGIVQAIPRIEAVLFPNIGHTQVRANQVDGIEDRFPTIGDVDPYYRIILSLPQPQGDEVCAKVNQRFEPMGVLVSGQIEIEKKGKKYEIPIVALNLWLNGGQLNEHQGPLLRMKEKA